MAMCRVVSCRVVSCRVVSCRVVSCRAVSCHHSTEEHTTADISSLNILMYYGIVRYFYPMKCLLSLALLLAFALRTWLMLSCFLFTSQTIPSRPIPSCPVTSAPCVHYFSLSSSSRLSIFILQFHHNHCPSHYSETGHSRCSTWWLSFGAPWWSPFYSGGKWVGCIQYNTVQYNTIQYNTIQYNTIQYNTIQYNAMQYNAMQCNTLQYKYPYYPLWLTSAHLTASTLCLT